MSERVWNHQPAKRHRAGRLAKMTHAEHVADVAAKYNAAAGRTVAHVISGAIHIDGVSHRIGDVARAARAMRDARR